MKKMKLNGQEVLLYDSIDEMPIMNFQKYNKCLIIDSGIGSDIDDIDEHIIKIARFIKADEKKKAMQELQNMRQNIFMVNSNISPKYFAFAALIKSINGQEVTDLSDENLKSILDTLKTVKHSVVVDLLNWIKKKITEELDTYFPGIFSNAKEKTLYDKIKSRTSFVLDHILNGSDNKEDIEKLDSILLGMYSPKNFIGRDSIEIRYDKQFENTCILIAQELNLDAKKMTVLQFYSSIETIKEQNEMKIKAFNKYKRK